MTIFLSILGITESRPFYDGVHPKSKNIFSRYPLLDDHSRELRNNNIPLIVVQKFNMEQTFKNGILFAIPQFYEQGFMTLPESKKVRIEMLTFIKEQNPNSKIDISLHPRMGIKNYQDIFKNFHQNNFTEIIQFYDKFYAINSSTVFLANEAGCKLNIFRCNFLDYEIIEKNINPLNINFIDWNVKENILLN